MRLRPSHRASRWSAPGRPVRAALAAVAAGAVVAAAGVLAAPATAVSAPVVRVVTGNRTLTVAWKAVPGATGYTVRWGGADHNVGTALHKTIPNLVNGRSTKVRVTARGATASSTTVSGTPAAGYPLAITGATATTGTGDSIVVKATGGGRATRIGVIAGGNSTTGTFSFHTPWYPATQRTFTVKVPSTLLSKLGHTTGNFVYVKVVQTNSLAANPAMHLTSDSSEAYRVSSPPGTRALAGVKDPVTTASAVSRLTVGEMNVQSISATAGFTRTNHWVNRAPRVAKTMLAAHPDLILTAELSTSKLDDSCTNHPSKGYWCPTQHSDLAARLKQGGGYAQAFPDAEQRVSDFVAAHPSLASQVTFGTHIFFDPTKLSLGAHGTISPRATLKVTSWPSSIADRWLSWAVLTVKASGKRFVAVAVHLPAGHRSTDINARAEEAKLLVPYLDKKAAGLPIVVAGDFNADPINDPNPDMRILLEHGYFDAAATPHRIGSRYATFDGHNGSDGDDYGYPDTVHPYKYAATRIDFVMTKGSPYTYRYENVLHFASGSSTVLDPTYRGSDHLFQLATVGIGAGATS